MDSSKNFSGAEECSSSESGWTTYIASPEKGCNDIDNDEDDDDGASIAQQGYKREDDKEKDEGDSDDSMASDASSGPCDQGNVYHAEKKSERQHVGKRKEEKKGVKGEKDRGGNRGNSGGRLKKL